MRLGMPFASWGLLVGRKFDPGFMMSLIPDRAALPLKEQVCSLGMLTMLEFGALKNTNVLCFLKNNMPQYFCICKLH